MIITAAHMLIVKLNLYRCGFDKAHAFDMMCGLRTAQNIAHMGYIMTHEAKSIARAAQIITCASYSEANASSCFLCDKWHACVSKSLCELL